MVDDMSPKLLLVFEVQDQAFPLVLLPLLLQKNVVVEFDRQGIFFSFFLCGPFVLLQKPADRLFLWNQEFIPPLLLFSHQQADESFP